MPRRSGYDPTAIEELLRANERVVTHAELIALGMPRSTICHRKNGGGTWQFALPGVVIGHRGTPTRRERSIAGLKYAGDGALITGASGLREYGVRERVDDRIHVLVPAARSRTSHHFLIVERTNYLPRPVLRSGLPIAPIERCTIDACRRDVPLGMVRAAVSEVVQRGLCPPGLIRNAMRQMPTQRTAAILRVMSEIDAGTRSAAESDVRDVFRGSTVQEPEWNVRLCTTDGELICSPDGWWEDIGGALQIDSMEWHLGPEEYKRTQAVQRELARHGIPFLSWAPSDITRDPVGFLRTVEDFRRQNLGRPLPDILVVRKRPGDR